MKDIEAAAHYIKENGLDDDYHPPEGQTHKKAADDLQTYLIENGLLDNDYPEFQPSTRQSHEFSGVSQSWYGRTKEQSKPETVPKYRAASYKATKKSILPIPGVGDASSFPKSSDDLVDTSVSDDEHIAQSENMRKLEERMDAMWASAVPFAPPPPSDPTWEPVDFSILGNVNGRSFENGKMEAKLEKKAAKSRINGYGRAPEAGPSRKHASGSWNTNNIFHRGRAD